MNHPDKRTAEIIARNAAALGAAVQAPPPDIAGDTAAYLTWTRNKPQAPHKPPKPGKFVNYTRRHHRRPPGGQEPAQPRDGYAEASARLLTLPDLGAASIAAARGHLGTKARYEDLVIHAAAHPVMVPAGNERIRNDLKRSGTDAPACGCGTALDPDGTCLTCTTGPAA